MCLTLKHCFCSYPGTYHVIIIHQVKCTQLVLCTSYFFVCHQITKYCFPVSDMYMGNTSYWLFLSIGQKQRSKLVLPKDKYSWHISCTCMWLCYIYKSWHIVFAYIFMPLGEIYIYTVIWLTTQVNEYTFV